MKDVLIIGAGIAGLTAAMYALRAGMSVAVCEKNTYGGQASIIETIENYPGCPKISGADFCNTIYEQAQSFGAEFIFDEVTGVNLEENSKTVITSAGNKIEAKTVIIANGLKRRTLGCLGEKEFSGKGVSYCATCDGAFFKDKSVVIVGGGNTALEDALYLANICKKVTMVVRKNSFRGEQYLVDAVNKKDNIFVMFESQVTDISGDKTVTGVSVVSGDIEQSEKIAADGVFVAIGYSPDNEMYRKYINMNESGYFVAGESCKTNIPGVFVAGDCRIKPLRQLTTAAADGAISGSAAASFIIQNFS